MDLIDEGNFSYGQRLHCISRSEQKIHLGRTKLVADWCGDIAMVLISVQFLLLIYYLLTNKIKLRYRFNW